MTRVNTEQKKHTPWFAQAGTACSIVPISRAVGPHAFALKGGGYAVLFSVAGIDEESLTDQELEAKVRGLEGALRSLTEGFCLYQYTRVLSGFEIPRQAKYADPVTEHFVSDRLTFLNETAKFRRVDIHWCLTLEPTKQNPFSSKPKEHAEDTSRRLAELLKAATILESHLGHSIGLKLMYKEPAFQFFSYLFNLEEWAERDHLRWDTGAAGARAADLVVDDLSDAIRSLDKKAQGLYSLTLLLAGKSAEQLRDVAPAVHRAFVDARAQVMEETLGNLSAFYALFPGNQKFQVFSMWLGEDHHARLSSIFAPHIGHPHSEDLDAEYLNVLETRNGTPFFQDPYVNGVKVSMTLGPTGSGKSVFQNQATALEQKYGGFTYIFDIGGSYESVVELYGGKVDRVGKDGPRVNPFSLAPTENNIKFLHAFVKLLLTNGGAELTPEDDDTVHKAVQEIYHLDASLRRLSSLFLPTHLQRYLGKWIGTGVYAAVFDNVKDELALGRLQCFDFQGVNNKQYADLIEPLMVWLLRRIEDVLYDPKNLGIPKHIVIEELFSSMKNKQLLDAALASIKTVRKNLGGVTLIGQSAMDLGDNADSIVNSCTSFLFLPDATFNREHYRKLFNLSDQQIELFESLQPREALYIRRDGITKVVRLNLDARSYATFSTKPKDRVRRSRLIDKYGLTEGIDRFAQGETA